RFDKSRIRRASVSPKPSASSVTCCVCARRWLLSSKRSTASSPNTLGLIETPLAQRMAKPPVLRQAALRDVQLREHLDARDHFLGLLLAGQPIERCHHAIEPKLGGDARSIAFEMQ